MIIVKIIFTKIKKKNVTKYFFKLKIKKTEQ